MPAVYDLDVSVGPAIALAAYSLAADAAAEIIRDGTYDRTRAALTFHDLNTL